MVFEAIGREIERIIGVTPARLLPKLEVPARVRGITAVAGAALATGLAAPGFVFPALGKVAKGIAKFVAPKTLKGALTVGTAGIVGGAALAASPELRKAAVKFVKEAPKRLASLGTAIGKGVEEGKPITVAEGLKAAGLVGAGAALAAAGLAAVPKIKEAIKRAPDIPVTAEILPGQVMPVEVAPSLEQIPGEVIPELVPEVIPATPAVAAPVIPAIKNIFKPSIEIDIRNTGIRKTFKKQEILCCP